MDITNIRNGIQETSMLRPAAGPERVAAIVVTYKRPALLQACLRGILAQTRKPDGVIVLNNAPEEDVLSRVRSEFPGVGVVTLSENSGSGGGFACALQIANRCGYEWTWLLDDDAIPEPNALEELLTVAARSRVAGVPLGMAASLQVSPYGTFGGGHWRHRVVTIPAAQRNGSHPYPIDVAYWAGLLVHGSVMERVGYPRADFFRCFADYEYCLRLKRAAMEIIAVPTSRVTHHEGAYRTVVRLGRRSIRLRYDATRHYYAARNAAYTAWHILRNPLAILFHTTKLVRLAVGDLLHEEDGPRRVVFRIRGTLDGLRGRLGRRTDLE